MIRGLESRISRLEQYRKPRCCYVINCSDPPTADVSEISRAKAEGRRVAVLPRVCATVEEWIATYGPRADEHA
jgi:hypothetical protein